MGYLSVNIFTKLFDRNVITTGFFLVEREIPQK